VSARPARIALAATLHDPPGALLADIARFLPALQRAYETVAVASSPPTARRIRAALAAVGADAGSPPANTRGPLYRLALRRALAGGAPRVHYLDFDRALHWVARRPTELATLLQRAEREPALLVGRTPRAHASHHEALVATEADAAARFATRLGLRGRVDFLVPSFVLRRAAVARLLARSRARNSTLYGEWVALLVGLGEHLTYVECEGLEWETPDRHRDQVRRVGLPAWRRALSTPTEWTLRRAMADEFVRGMTQALRRFPVRTPVRVSPLRERSPRPLRRRHAPGRRP
jgi:hypothetical protein